MRKYLYASLTRISDLRDRGFVVEAIPRGRWETGDYAVGEVLTSPGPTSRLELQTGRMAEVLQGDRVVGALGVRYATLEAVGSWREVGDDLRLEALTGGGLLGRVTSYSELLGRFIPLRYLGHVTRDGSKVCMRDFVTPVSTARMDTPVILIVGTSMSAGKTTSAKVIIRELKQLDLTIVGAKLTGAGRYRDILSMQDAGADHIFDFVDVGLPSTVMDPAGFRAVLEQLLSRIAAVEADVVVVEAGASPLEPYNGGVAVEMLNHAIRCTVLGASDPYSVVGIVKAFGRTPDVVTGPATNTEAGIALVEKLAGIPGINVMDQAQWPKLREVLQRTLQLG